jgi:ceramide glucosyltransferase
MLFLYVVFGIAIALGILSLIDGSKSMRHIRTYRPRTTWRPRVVVFCPCRGVDHGFKENVRSILDQDYAPLRVVFIVDSASDPAAKVLSVLNATVLVAGEAADRGQKVHNLIYGVEHASGDAEVFVFCDADARFPREWIATLLAPLESPDVAVATGYRWYAAETGTLPALQRSAWNASVVTALGDHNKNFAWGGSTALTRATFDGLEIRKAWNGALSDDYAVTMTARKSGKRIVFVPECLVPSYGDCTWGELLEFTTRQIVITRVYDPTTWWLLLVSQTVFNLAFWGGVFMSGFFLLVPLALYLLAGIKSYLRYETVATVLPPPALSKHRASYILLAPLTALLFEFNLVRSVLTRSITWRQIRYRLVSPDRTVVQRGAGES